jgi:Flp pilus assembly protein TadG
MNRNFHSVFSNEDGSEIIEFLGLLPLLLMIGLIIVQVLLAGQTIMVANSAAREGARAAAVCEDVGGAVVRASPGFSPQIQRIPNGTEVTVKVSLQVPTIGIRFLQTMMPIVTGSSTMRFERTRPCQ